MYCYIPVFLIYCHLSFSVSLCKLPFKFFLINSIQFNLIFTHSKGNCIRWRAKTIIVYEKKFGFALKHFGSGKLQLIYSAN